MADKERQREPGVTVALKHSLAARWMHWLNFPFLAMMIWSGLAIYWADTDPDGSHFHTVYRLGVGNWTLVRLFPDWFFNHLGMQFGLAKGLSYHFALMWLFAANGIAYVIYLAASGEWRLIVPHRGSFRDAFLVVLHDLHLRRDAPLATKYNGAQRIAYTGVILMGAASLVTGLAIYKPVQVGWLTHLLGGYLMARWWHFWLTMAFVAFFVLHVVQVVLAGWNNFRSMVTGLEVVPATAIHARTQTPIAEPANEQVEVLLEEPTEEPAVEPAAEPEPSAALPVHEPETQTEGEVAP